MNIQQHKTAHIVVPGKHNFTAPVVKETTAGVYVAHCPTNPSEGEWFTNKFVIGITEDRSNA